MSHSLDSLKGVCRGLYRGRLGIIEGGFSL